MSVQVTLPAPWESCVAEQPCRMYWSDMRLTVPSQSAPLLGTTHPAFVTSRSHAHETWYCWSHRPCAQAAVVHDIPSVSPHGVPSPWTMSSGHEVEIPSQRSVMSHSFPAA